MVSYPNEYCNSFLNQDIKNGTNRTKSSGFVMTPREAEENEENLISKVLLQLDKFEADFIALNPKMVNKTKELIKQTQLRTEVEQKQGTDE